MVVCHGLKEGVPYLSPFCSFSLQTHTHTHTHTDTALLGPNEPTELNNRHYLPPMQIARNDSFQFSREKLKQFLPPPCEANCSGFSIMDGAVIYITRKLSFNQRNKTQFRRLLCPFDSKILGQYLAFSVIYPEFVNRSKK